IRISRLEDRQSAHNTLDQSARSQPTLGKSRVRDRQSMAFDQAAWASAAWASALMRLTIERKPFERCGVRCSLRPSRSKSEIASVSKIFRADCPEYNA